MIAVRTPSPELSRRRSLQKSGERRWSERGGGTRCEWNARSLSRAAFENLVQCEMCLECEADGAVNVAYNASLGGHGYICGDCLSDLADKERCVVCRVCNVSRYAVCGGTRYCLPCYGDWLITQGQAGATPSSKRQRVVADGAAAANAERNEKNMALLREWFPAYCPYHLYFHHVRDTRECEYGDADECTKGSHAAPPGLAVKARGLDLVVEH